MSIETEKLYKNSADFDVNNWRWPHFSINELKCKCNKYCKGEYYHSPKFLNGLEKMRSLIGEPIIINSGHRCAVHNYKIGGASQSIHTKAIAADIRIDIKPFSRKALYDAAIQSGFTGLGFGVNFLHIDMGRKRRWDYPNSINAWKKELGFNPLSRV